MPVFDRFALLKPTALAAALACAGVQAQVVPTTPSTVTPSVVLKPSTLLVESLSDKASREAASFFFADSVRGRADLDTVLDGNAVLRKHSTVIRADRIEYYAPNDRVTARGNVRVRRNGNSFEGPLLDLRVDAFEGFLAAPRFEFLKNASHGAAERVDFLDDKRAVVKNAWYTSCRKDMLQNPAQTLAKAWLPDWVLSAASIKLDTEADDGLATDAVLRFKNVPVLAVPRLSFPLSDARRSGFLPPSFNLDNISGFEITQPYYLNIAPNRDATLEPTVRLRRGLDLGGEFRYLEPSYTGNVRGSVMPYDSLRGQSRWSLVAKHQGDLPVKAAGLDLGSWRLGLDMARVSDDNFWRDFPRSGTALTQRLLPADFTLSRGFTLGQNYVALNTRTLSWQTLQDTASPITPPYDRLPQITLSSSGQKLWSVDGLAWQASADGTRFVADRSRTLQPNTARAVLEAEVSRTWGGAGYYVSPKLKVHSTHYNFDSPLANGRQTASRSLPTFSMDAGMAFERDMQFGGKSFIQTLEPRAFYVRTPFRDQSALPNYDSGANDFNFATIYSENAFVGNDRIADANLLTLGATSRWLNPATGAELARLAVAQRLRLSSQKVALPGGVGADERVSDLLLGGTVTGDIWALDTTVQYNQAKRQSVRATVGGRYSPGKFQTLNMAYRFQRDQSEQIDLSWQWPLAKLAVPGFGPLAKPDGSEYGRWYTVGRLNYSAPDRRLVDAVLGVEYDADCWLARFVLERLQRGVSGTVSGPESSKRLLFQLEFVGFSRLGNNPLAALQQNIPRYKLLREQVSTPSRFSQYE